MSTSQELISFDFGLGKRRKKRKTVYRTLIQKIISLQDFQKINLKGKFKNLSGLRKIIFNSPPDIYVELAKKFYYTPEKIKYHLSDFIFNQGYFADSQYSSFGSYLANIVRLKSLCPFDPRL